jgi:creatinine amidohydrolase
VIRIADLNWMQLEAYLDRDDRIVLPLGSTEQHAFLSLATDSLLAERVAVEAAEPLGVPVLPALAYGVTPYFATYPGSPSLSSETYANVLRELIASLQGKGFRRILLVNGHGGNVETATGALTPGVRLHSWWAAPRLLESVRELDADAAHASWMENFPWTRLADVVMPDRHKPAVPSRPDDPADLRRILGDGSYGGWYHRPDDEMLALWQVGVEETRAAIETL